jgi:hypothetical protein
MPRAYYLDDLEKFMRPLIEIRQFGSQSNGALRHGPYLDSVDFKETEATPDFGFVEGSHHDADVHNRHGITDIDGAIVKPLACRASGGGARQQPVQILAEAERLLGLPLEREPVFRVPISNDGVKACKRLVDKGHRVNVH